MKRVYLDQNKWVALAAARAGLAKGEPYRGVLALADAGVEAGLLSFPLSRLHYMETHNRRDWRSRSDLAETMAGVSKFHAIAPIGEVLPGEIDRAFQQTFGRPYTCRPIQPFGVGAAHAFATDIPPYQAPDELELPPGLRWQVEQSAQSVKEWVLLAGVPPELESQLEDYDPKAHLPAGHEWALRQEELREVRSEAGYNRGEGAQRVADAEAYVDHIDLLNDALAWAGLSADLIYEAQAEGMSAMLPRIPTLHASAELQRLRHIASPRRFDANDLGDLSALPAAIVYCDVVVTEKEWAAAARRAKLDTYNDTVVLSDLTELPLHLV